MSIIQEYQKIRKELGEAKYQAIEVYLDQNKELFLSDIYYKEIEWNKFLDWYENKKIENYKQGYNDFVENCFYNK